MGIFIKYRCRIRRGVRVGCVRMIAMIVQCFDNILILVVLINTEF